MRGTPRPGDQPHATLVRQVAPDPLEHHQRTILEADEQENVHQPPQRQGQPTSDVQLAELGDRRLPTDDGQLALVAVAEGLARLALQGTPDVARRRRPLLDGDGPQAG